MIYLYVFISAKEPFPSFDVKSMADSKIQIDFAEVFESAEFPHVKYGYFVGNSPVEVQQHAFKKFFRRQPYWHDLIKDVTMDLTLPGVH